MKLQKSTLDNDLSANSRHRGKVRTVQSYGNNNENNDSPSRIQIRSSGYRGRGSGNYGRGSGNYGRNQDNNNTSDNNRSETPDSDRGGRGGYRGRGDRGGRGGRGSNRGGRGGSRGETKSEAVSRGNYKTKDIRKRENRKKLEKM